MFDALIIGGGPSGVSCALVLGSAWKKEFMSGRKIGIITHQKTSNLNEALFNNAYGIAPGTLGADLLQTSLHQLSSQYPHISQIEGGKVLRIEGGAPDFTVVTNKNSYKAAIVVIAIGWANTFAIEGLTQYVEPHKKAIPEKMRIQLKNDDHKVAEGIYVAGTLAGWRSQLAIAAGSGAAIATDIMTLWNNGTNSQSHESVKKPLI